MERSRPATSSLQLLSLHNAVKSERSTNLFTQYSNHDGSTVSAFCIATRRSLILSIVRWMNSEESYSIYDIACFLSRPARPASCTKLSIDEGWLILIVNRTFGLSIPIPNAFVATIKFNSFSLNLVISPEGLSPPTKVPIFKKVPNSVLRHVDMPSQVPHILSSTPNVPCACGQKTIPPLLYLSLLSAS